ncbi:phage/plasmid replication protein [Pseudomonas huanghezhanensis]|uniref:phage/plasmid replication protein n=1 Tax=Pseudomonas huanghezhanensis TaxID=3002903 RepID=UPI002285DD63|nr:phage/plasmid replication protein [Pseudomonas sp. BSw22131]
MVRSEIKCRSEFLKRESLQFWGLFDEDKLLEIHRGFLMIGEKCEINNFDLLTVADELLSKNVVDTRKAAMTTAGMPTFGSLARPSTLTLCRQDASCRLRLIGIDIKLPFDCTRHGIVFIRNVREVERKFDTSIPAFYRHAVIPRHLHLVAA